METALVPLSWPFPGGVGSAVSAGSPSSTSQLQSRGCPKSPVRLPDTREVSARVRLNDSFPCRQPVSVLVSLAESLAGGAAEIILKQLLAGQPPLLRSGQRGVCVFSRDVPFRLVALYPVHPKFALSGSFPALRFSDSRRLPSRRRPHPVDSADLSLIAGGGNRSFFQATNGRNTGTDKSQHETGSD